MMRERERGLAGGAADLEFRLADEQQLAVLQSLPIILYSRWADPPFRPIFLSGAVKEITGFEPADFLFQRDLCASRTHPDDFANVIENLFRASATGGYACEYRWRCADGRYRIFQDQGVLSAGREGDRREFFGSIVDVTDRRRLDDAQAGAQKMEAIGRLTGGVAHDFNNLLTVILGNADMLLTRDEDENRRVNRIAAIRKSAERARALTRQLLAFARRQRLEPEVIDLTRLIQDIEPVLRHAVGEAVTLRLDFEVTPRFANLDASQLRTALLNLAANARDAMPSGGAFSLSLRDVEDGGRWVEIDVSDTGEGMSEEVKARAFEPYFSTKGVGVGSGLGLSQVYGFVSQSGGTVHLWSEPGHGAQFKLRLPLSAAPVGSEVGARPDPLPLGGSERLLVVEDDASVLRLTVETLQSQGYRVLTAMNAAEAMAHLESLTEIEILFSDVVMPGGVDGVELARRARRLRPGLRVLLTSGYVGESAMLPAEFPLLDKPYEAGALLAALRKVLDAPEPRAGAMIRRRVANSA